MVLHFFLAQLHLHLLFTAWGPLLRPCHTGRDRVPNTLCTFDSLSLLTCSVSSPQHPQPFVNSFKVRLVHMSKTNSLSGIKAIFISAHSDYNAKSRVCCLKFHLIWLVFSFLFFFPLIWLGFKTILPSYILHLHMRLIPLKPGGSLQIWKIYKPDNHSPGTGVTTIYRI